MPPNKDIPKSPLTVASSYKQILQNPFKLEQAVKNTGYLSQRSLSNAQNKSFGDSAASKHPDHNYVSEVLKFDTINKKKSSRANISSTMPNERLRQINPKIFDLLFQLEKSDDAKTAQKKRLR